MKTDIINVVRSSYEAYVGKDRAAIEALLAEDFQFTSPLDNRVDRAKYCERCWPISASVKGFDFIHLTAHESRVFSRMKALPPLVAGFAIRRVAAVTRKLQMWKSISDGQFRMRRSLAASRTTSSLRTFLSRS